jgi:hypothetical protein
MESGVARPRLNPAQAKPSRKHTLGDSFRKEAHGHLFPHQWAAIPNARAQHFPEFLLASAQQKGEKSQFAESGGFCLVISVTSGNHSTR